LLHECLQYLTEEKNRIENIHGLHSFNPGQHKEYLAVGKVAQEPWRPTRPELIPVSVA